MEVYRISKSKYIKDLSGTGAKLFGGRWNPKGYSVLYTSANRSLAALEYLVHIDPKTIPDDLKLLTIQLPENLLIKFDLDKFNRIKQKKNASLLFKDAGRKWIESNGSLALEVPSILIPEEKNVLINPEHNQMDQVKIREIEDFKFDERFFM